jgi:hypothetical protein
MSTMKLRRQAAAFVRKDGFVHLVTWVEVAVDGVARTELAVLRLVRALVPGDRVGYGFDVQAEGIARAEVSTWLGEHGYELVGELDGPDVEQPISRW